MILELPIAEVAPFAGDGVAEDVGHTRSRLTTGSWSWASLAAQLARFDAEVEVVRPPALRVAFAELARRAARAGETSDPVQPGPRDQGCGRATLSKHLLTLPGKRT